MALIDHHKHRIAKEVTRLANKTSQKRVGYNAGVSGSTINHIVNGKWQHISEEMWRKIRVNLRIELDWNTAETANFKILTGLCKTAKDRAISIAVADHAGKGKSETYKWFERNYTEVIYIQCQNLWTRKEYIHQLSIAAGIGTNGTMIQLVNRFLKHLKGLNRPLIIIDQFDKLKDSQLDLFMDFYNELDGHAGFILSGVLALEKRILRGVNYAKIGYEELYSRVARKFIRLNPISLEDVKAICNANGLHDEDEINKIFNLCDQDLRRVKRDVEKYHLKTIHQKEVVFEEVKAPKGETNLNTYHIDAEDIIKAVDMTVGQPIQETIKIIQEWYPMLLLSTTEIEHYIELEKSKLATA